MEDAAADEQNRELLMLPGYVEQYSVKSALNLVVFFQETS